MNDVGNRNEASEKRSSDLIIEAKLLRFTVFLPHTFALLVHRPRDQGVGSILYPAIGSMCFGATTSPRKLVTGRSRV